MKKVLLLIALFTTQWAVGQTIVVLELPNPCAQNSTEEVLSQGFDFDVFPNPADKSVTLSFSDIQPVGKLEVQVTDMKGVAVLRNQYYSDFNELRTEMALDKLAPGVYTISVRGKETYSVKKLIIKN